MTKEITKANILQEIENKFKLRELIPEKFTFLESVMPTYNIEPHLCKGIVLHAYTSISAGPAAYLYFTVPQNKKWYLHGYNVIFQTGVYTIAGLMVYRRLVTEYFYIDLKAAQSVSYTLNLPKDVVLWHGDKLYLYVDGYTSTGNLELRLDVTEEEVR